jgi:glycosyltransferase involved in cell wall biosynthesis
LSIGVQGLRPAVEFAVSTLQFAFLDPVRVWLLTVGEPLPTDTAGDRLWRTGLLASRLVQRGHDVVWWSSAFDHFARRVRSPIDAAVTVDPRLTVWHLSGVSYRRNISLARLRNHQQVAGSFRRLAPTESRPDVIVSSLPTLELCEAAVEYGVRGGVPVALDIRDLWPDVIFDMLPAPARVAGRWAGRWMERQLQRATAGATAILGVTDEFVHWGLNAAGRDASERDRAFPMGYSVEPPDDSALQRAAESWRARGIDASSPRAIICFFGTLGWMFDFETVLEAAARLRTVAPTVTIVICGGGGSLDALRRRANGLPNVILPGRVDAAEVRYLMRQSMAGLAPYRPYRNFDENLPNKPIEYLAGGLPIVGCRLRVLTALVEEHGCGLTYAHGDVDGLVDAIVRLAGDPELRASMAKRATRLYRDRFVAERVYDGMAAHLERLASRVQ